MNNLAISLAGAIAVGLLPAQNILLPDNHHLGESQAQVFASGSTSWWGTTTSLTGRHFQALYDASHFTGVGGVTGPVGITNLRFRGEDTEHNTGGQTFTGVTATIYSTSLASTAALSTTFATNTALGVSTLLGTVVIPTLTASASSGKAPNDFILDISFTVPTLPYDPTVSGPGSQPNFLVDIVYTAQTVGLPPELSTMIATQDTAGGAVVVRGRGLFAATAIAATGTVSTAPPVIGVQISGAGGYATLLPARNERYGAGCGGAPSAFYQLFAHNEYFDLKDPGQVDGVVGLTLTPDTYPNPTFYTVTSGSAPVDVTNGIGGTPINIGEDATVAFGPIPAFQYPGGPAGGTTALRPSSNGYVILDPTSTETAADFSVSVDEFLGVTAATNVARLCPFWHDFSPQKNIGLDPLSGQYAVVNIANPAEVLVTWYRVGRFNSVAEPGQEYHTMQLSLNTSNGVVEFRYGAMDEIWGDTFTTSAVTGGMSGITGFTRGRIGAVPSVDPQSRDLSIERPFSTAVEGTTSNMGNVVVATPVAAGPVYMGRAFYGQTLTWNASNIPAGAMLGVQLLDITGVRPGLQDPTITVPGCILSVSLNTLLWEVTANPPATVIGTVPFAVPPAGYPGFLGFELFAQYVILDGLFVGGPLLTATSNAVHTTVGLQ